GSPTNGNDTGPESCGRLPPSSRELPPAYKPVRGRRRLVMLDVADIGHFIQLWLRHPVLVALLAVVVAILLGAGRGLGLPLLFWHERRAPQLLAGLATTLLAAEVFFVAYLLAGQDHFSGDLGLLRFMAYGGLAWAVVVLVVLARGVGALTPGIRGVHAGRAAAMLAGGPPRGCRPRPCPPARPPVRSRRSPSRRRPRRSRPLRARPPKRSSRRSSGQARIRGCLRSPRSSSPPPSGPRSPHAGSERRWSA